MDRAEKAELVQFMTETFDGASVVIVTRAVGLSVDESTDLRRRMRAAGAGFKMMKNRLAKIALKGTKYEALDPLFTGQTAMAWSDDPVAPAKVASEFAEKNDKLEIVGGALGDKQLDADGVKALAKLPSLDELRGTLIGVIQAPATKVAGVLAAPAGQLARVLQAKADKEQAAA